MNGIESGWKILCNRLLHQHEARVFEGRDFEGGGVTLLTKHPSLPINIKPRSN